MTYGLPDWLTTPFGSTSQPAQPASVRQKSKDGGYVAPDRNAREICYESRDIFFECLDKNNILDAVTHDAEARQKCPQENSDYERDCARSWIKYFKEKRVMEANRDATIAKIKKDDAELVEKAKEKRKKAGAWFS